MNEFTTMYQFFKGISESSKTPDEAPTPIAAAEIPTKHEGEGYLVMSASGSDVTDSAVNAVSNLNYLNVDEPDASLIELEEMVGKTSVSLKISEGSYYDSNEMNENSTAKHSDDLDLEECSNTLDQLASFNSSSDSSDYQNDSVATPPEKPKNGEFGDYLTHPSNIPVASPNYSNVVSPKKIRTTYKDEASHLRLHFKKKDDFETKFKAQQTLKRQASDVSKKSVDDELLEIINDFKNNVFTIQEVEQLVSTWKNRNDVQKSFMEKAEQLQRMREEYDRIQREMKEKLKRPTPFERMKKLFSRKSPHKETPSEAATPTVDDIKFSLVSATVPAIPNGHRPISSLSLHSVSSSSSGRMSTGSACSSLGDSGTHSDNDTRRNLYARSVLDNYLVPPAPRPVVTPASTPTPVDEKDRPCFPRNNSSEHYILFPSNVPYTPTDSHASDYINYPTLKTIDESDAELGGMLPMSLIQIKQPEVTYAQVTLKGASEPASSSFKPNSPAVTIAAKNTEQLLNELKFNEICKSIEDLTVRSPSTSSGTNSTLQSPHHEYMNIKI